MDIKQQDELGPETAVAPKMPDDTKVRINELLFTLLPDDITLRQTDDLALQIYEAIQRAWEAKH